MSQEVIKDDKPIPAELIQDIKSLIEESRRQIVTTVNSALTALYWQIGKRVNDEILEGKRADYGKQILRTLSEDLTAYYGNSFSEKNLRHMARFAAVFADEQIVSAVQRQLSWTHLKTLIYIDDPLKREFYKDDNPRRIIH